MAKLRLDTGEEATATAMDENVLTILSPRAFAPGAPIRFSMLSEPGERQLEGRTLGSKRTDPGTFEVRLRFVNLRRADREAILEALA